MTPVAERMSAGSAAYEQRDEQGPKDQDESSRS